VGIAIAANTFQSSLPAAAVVTPLFAVLLPPITAGRVMLRYSVVLRLECCPDMSRHV
jgi:hypothetical protein